MKQAYSLKTKVSFGEVVSHQRMLFRAFRQWL